MSIDEQRNTAANRPKETSARPFRCFRLEKVALINDFAQAANHAHAGPSSSAPFGRHCGGARGFCDCMFCTSQEIPISLLLLLRAFSLPSLALVSRLPLAVRRHAPRAPSSSGLQPTQRLACINMH
jgi:hypothetical protein